MHNAYTQSRGKQMNWLYLILLADIIGIGAIIAFVIAVEIFFATTNWLEGR